MDRPTRTVPEVPANGAPLGVPPALDAPPVASGAPVTPVCSNCGAVLVGPYCAQCGQEAAHRMVSLGRIVEDALEDQLSLNAALPRTLSALLLHPGRLTREYVAGRIRSYLPPMRVYLVSSVLFFLVVAGVPNRIAHNAPAARVSFSSDSSPGGVHAGPPWLQARMRRLRSMSQRDVAQQILASMFGAAPKLAFVLLPLFAALLKLLYIRRGRLYIEHFVFALHTHAVAFLAFTVMVLAGLVAANFRIPFDLDGWVDLVLCVWLVVYFFHALRVFYGQGWLKTLVKMGALACMYLMVLVLATAGAALFAFLTI